MGNVKRRILFCTIGSLGDLHPFIAVARAAQERGDTAVMAVPADHVEKCRNSGLEAHAVWPAFEDIPRDRSRSAEEHVRAVMRSPDYLIRAILLPSLEDAARRLLPLCEGVDLVACSMFALPVPIAARAHAKPIVPVVLQPTALLSAEDPPETPDFRLMARPPLNGLTRVWNRAAVALIRAELHRRYAPPLNRVRRAFGLGALTAVPIFDVEDSAPLRLALYDPAFAPPPKDAPNGLMACGFPWFDSESGRFEGLSSELLAFLDRGEPPIVFTLGSFAVHTPGDFYGESVKAARALGRRTVLLTGPQVPKLEDLGNDVYATHYARHSLLFPRASLIVHHGGIGTTGQALRAGRPQLVVPFMGDQPDNAARLVRLGVARSLSRYAASPAARVMGEMLNEPGYSRRAAQVATELIPNAATRAAAALTEVADMRSQAHQALQP